MKALLLGSLCFSKDSLTFSSRLSLVSISTNYTKKGLKKSTQIEILTRDNLDEKVKESLEKHKDPKSNAFIKSSNHNDELHFGYLLLGIMNNNT